jgi:RHS repeat-associated protein
MPSAWEDKPIAPPSAKKVIQGYLDAFDPDAIVQFSTTLPTFIGETGIEIIKPHDIWRPLAERNLSPQCGIGIFEVTVSGLNDFLFREYHPVSGRWIQPDPAGAGAVSMANPQSWNRYAYVSNSPSLLVDALGLVAGNPCSGRWVCPDGGGGAGGGDPFAIFDGPNGQKDCYVSSQGDIGNGTPAPCDFVYDLAAQGDALFCRSGGCESIRQDPDTGQWQQITGWHFREVLDLNGGEPYDKLVPTWDYIADPTTAQGTLAANNGQTPNNQNQKQSKLNQASNAALHTFVVGQAIGTGVGCGVGALVAAGATAATETYPLAGATVPAGCVGGGMIGFFEALPYSALGAIVDFGWTYWGH